MVSKVALFILVLVASGVKAEDNFRGVAAFSTPIASTVEEAVRQQLLDRMTLPNTYETVLDFNGLPVTLQVGLEVAATRAVGRSLEFLDLPPSPQQNAVEELVRSACLRVPYAGWREHADLVAKRTASYWTEYEAGNIKVMKRRVIATPFYKFVVLMNFPRKLVVYNITTGVEELGEEIELELAARMGTLQPRGVPLAAAVPKGEACEEWFGSRRGDPTYVRSAIEHRNSRWPVAVHVRFASSFDGWSVVTGERSINAKDQTELDDAVVSFFDRLTASDGQSFPREILKLDGAQKVRPGIYCNLALLASREVVDGMDRIEVQFRCRGAVVDPK